MSVSLAKAQRLTGSRNALEIAKLLNTLRTLLIASLNFSELILATTTIFAKIWTRKNFHQNFFPPLNDLNCPF